MLARQERSCINTVPSGFFFSSSIWPLQAKYETCWSQSRPPRQTHTHIDPLVDCLAGNHLLIRPVNGAAWKVTVQFLSTRAQDLSAGSFRETKESLVAVGCVKNMLGYSLLYYVYKRVFLVFKFF